MDEKVSLFTSTHDVVMLDVGTHLNLCSSVSTNAYRELRKEASATSEWLNRDTGGSLGKQIKKRRRSNVVVIIIVHYTSCNYRQNYFYSFIPLLMCSL